MESQKDIKGKTQIGNIYLVHTIVKLNMVSLPLACGQCNIGVCRPYNCYLTNIVF